jgi:hypothetical protein
LLPNPCATGTPFVEVLPAQETIRHLEDKE